ncbi:MAG: hypothetical protein WD038_12560 [Balneolales bacterium]
MLSQQLHPKKPADYPSLTGYEINDEAEFVERNILVHASAELKKGDSPASFFSPLEKKDNNFIASCVIEETPIYLFIEENNPQRTVQDIVNVGLDHIKGYFAVKNFVKYTQNDEDVDSIEHIFFEGYDERLNNRNPGPL